LGDDYGRYLLRGFHGRSILTDARGTVPWVDCPSVPLSGLTDSSSAP
jgi:hypothetical protein